MATWHKVSQRTVKCPRCRLREFYIWESDSGASELRNMKTDKKHECEVGAKSAPVTVTATQVKKEDQDDAIAELARLIPAKYALDMYVPRAINGKTDLQTLEAAYHLNVAHMNRECLPTCDKKCRKLPVNVLLLSDTGAGKNHLVKALAAKLQIAYLRFPFNASVTPDTIFGRPWMPEAAKTVWMDGRLTKLVRHKVAGLVCLDEVNACPAEITFALHAAMDDERKLVIEDNSEVLDIPATVMFIGTANPDYAGTKPMNDAWADRFTLKLALDYEKSVEKKLLGDDKLLKFVKSLRDRYRKGDGSINKAVGTRALLAFAQNRANFGEEIARDSFITMFDSEDERRAVKEAFSLYIDADQPIDVEKDVNLDA